MKSRKQTISHIPAVVSARLARLIEASPPRLDTMEIGTIANVSRGVAHITGFTDVSADGHIRLSGGRDAIATSLNTREIGAILLGNTTGLRPGDNAYRTGKRIETATGDELLGRVVDPLGRPLDGGPPLRRSIARRVDQRAPDIIERAPVTAPLQTGLKAIDATVPIGKGQRELILGDRQTGKTAIAVGALMNQKATGVIGIYCAIGQRAAVTARVIDSLRSVGALHNVVVVSTSGEDTPGLQYIAPYAATTMAEHFMHQGHDVLIVYDDLTRHARAYRELSLLLRRPPGREAYPGDIFHIHARLLERATRLREAQGGGSMTALPIVETQAGNISAYIPTNLISITDGQIYLSSSLFQKGVLPAIDIGRSVSRIGGKAQLPAYRAVAQPIKLAYSQFEELESFARFATRLDDETRHAVERGRRVREVLKQGERDLLTVPEQVAVLLAVTSGLLDDIPLDEIPAAEATIRQAIRGDEQSVRMLTSQAASTDPWRESVLNLTARALQRNAGR